MIRGGRPIILFVIIDNPVAAQNNISHLLLPSVDFQRANAPKETKKHRAVSIIFDLMDHTNIGVVKRTNPEKKPASLLLNKFFPKKYTRTATRTPNIPEKIREENSEIPKILNENMVSQIVSGGFSNQGSPPQYKERNEFLAILSLAT
jgi:hypothetical protein